MMILLSCIAWCGFLCVLLLHLAAIAQAHWFQSELGAASIMPLAVLACVLMLIMLSLAHSWFWAEFLEHLTHAMSPAAKTYMMLSVLYPVVWMALGKSRGETLHALTIYHGLQVITAIMLPLFLIPACYFWKERPAKAPVAELPTDRLKPPVHLTAAR